jgi:hypothetical protein
MINPYCVTNQSFSCQFLTFSANPKVIPAIAGQWGKNVNGRPSLDAQMQAMRPFASQLTGVSHFAYSWQDPEHDQQRKFCRVK